MRGREANMKEEVASEALRVRWGRGRERGVGKRTRATLRVRKEKGKCERKANMKEEVTRKALRVRWGRGRERGVRKGGKKGRKRTRSKGGKKKRREGGREVAREGARQLWSARKQIISKWQTFYLLLMVVWAGLLHLVYLAGQVDS